MDTSTTPFLITSAIVALILLLLFTGFIIIIKRTYRHTYTLRHKACMSELHALEKERNRIAHDLHDEVTPMLTRALMSVDVCSNRYGQQVAGFLYPSKEILVHAIERLGDIIRNLDDERVIQQGLDGAVIRLLVQYRELQQLQFTFQYKVKRSLPRLVVIGFYRILLELLQNTVKHAHASRIELHIREWRQYIFFKYKDNGSGEFATAEGAGLGLRSLCHRVEVLGGVAEMPPEPGHVFQFHISLQPFLHVY